MSLLEAETDFGLGLLRESSINSSFVFSPLSIALALSLVHAGAKGNTRTQIGSALLKGANDDDVEKQYSELAKNFSCPRNGVEVNIANRLYVRNGFTVKQSYSDMIKQNFDADTESIDFQNEEQTAKIINAFVEGATKGKIRNLLEKSSMRADAVSYLINALYIKADWATKFTNKLTKEGDFFEAEGKTKKVNYLRTTGLRFYAECEHAQVLSLKYADKSYAFNIFLPKEKFGLKKLIAAITGKTLQEAIGKLKTTKVDISIPKIKIESKLDLQSALGKLGITDIFSSNADLSGIASGLQISKIAHKAIIEVDEGGTTAAAATSVEAVPKDAKPPVAFKADHPFLFVLTKNKHPVFIGTYY